MHASGGPGQVALVAACRDTLDRLRDYLRSAGVVALGTTHMEDCWELKSSVTRAAIVFPDAFPRGLVELAVSKLTRRRPRMRLVLVTARPSNFQALTESRPATQLMPMPVMGWALLSALGMSHHPSHEAPSLLFGDALEIQSPVPG